MAHFDPEEAFRRVFDRTGSGDLEALQEFVHPDYEEVWPQSGERVKGLANIRAILENFPGGALQRESERLVGGEDRWVATPAGTVFRIEGTGDIYTGVSKARYPDGSTWYVVTIAELRGEKFTRAEIYFAPVFEPPAWRARWVETGSAPKG